LQQTQPGEFQRYVLETRSPYHACLDLGDYDEDGDVDIALGEFRMRNEGGTASIPCLIILENRRISM
jgi:hypothetical protein